MAYQSVKSGYNCSWIWACTWNEMLLDMDILYKNLQYLGIYLNVNGLVYRKVGIAETVFQLSKEEYVCPVLQGYQSAGYFGQIGLVD